MYLSKFSVYICIKNFKGLRSFYIRSILLSKMKDVFRSAVKITVVNC